MSSTTTLSEAYVAVPMDVPNKDFEFTSELKEVPDSYAWVEDEHNNYPIVDSLCSENPPVIDLAGHPISEILKLVENACKTWGVFQVINHGVPKSLSDEIESVANMFFSLPEQEKMKVARTPTGMTGYGLTRIKSHYQNKFWYEGFTIVGSPLQHFQILWPNDYARLCETVEKYEEAMKNLAAKMLLLMLGSLGITVDDIDWAGSDKDFKSCNAALQMNYYPACPDPDRAMGLPDHTDSDLLSIIHQNKINGLQVLREGIGWVNVEPVPDALVINVGDLLHILSNGVFHSVLHRAVVNRTQHRLSAAYIYGPPDNTQISPLKKLVTPTKPPLYRTVTWNEYLRIKDKHYKKTLSAVRLTAATDVDNGYGPLDGK